ncbi:MAG: hypothetical protein JO184_12380 [Gammaproteobacteria bacterium]|nr:hypothetical protein [Gammaproteobacteria bacterium]
MSSADRWASATFAVMALVSLAATAPADARGEGRREGHESRAAEERPAARRASAPRASHPYHPARAQSAQASAHHQAAPAREYRSASENRQTAARRTVERSESRFAADGRAPVYRSAAGGQLRVVRYGNALSGTVERTIRPGLISRTFVGGGHVLYAHVYQRQVWYQFGRAISYETFVPAVRYPGVYYTWALTAWPHPVSYAWSWEVQPWYPVYGALFTPYPVYTTPDLWMTDYIIAQSMQTAYQAQGAQAQGAQAQAAPASQPAPQGSVAPVPESSPVAPAGTGSDIAPAAQASEAAPLPQPSGTSPAPTALPPAVTPEIKAQLNAQIKVQLQEQETAAAMPATLTTQSAPPALRPNHVFFEVVQPIEVPAGTANHYCSLSANDYIKRTGAMSSDDWTIPVVVELSGPRDCPQGLQTRIGLNDLNAMENEQEARVMEAMQAASRSMGPNGPPSGPGAHPTLIVDGSAAPDPGVLDVMRQAR